ncbi:Cdc7p-Dbf4p kinase complex regulatory subunit [Cystobasidiomycetes sp. EMM_F5]
MTPLKRSLRSNSSQSRQAVLSKGKQRAVSSTSRIRQTPENTRVLQPAAPIASRKRAREIDANDGQAEQSANLTARLDEAVVRNARALLAATTTGLGAPAEISRKRQRIDNNINTDLHNAAQSPVVVSSTETRPKRTRQQASNGIVISARNIFATPKTVPADVKPRLGAANDARSVTLAGANAIHPPAPSRPATRSSTSKVRRKQNSVKVERDSASRQKEQQALEWKVKYTRAFPNFVFYLDEVVDVKNRFEKCIVELGGRLEPFFSKSVTHVITQKTLPTAAETIPTVLADPDPFARPDGTAITGAQGLGDASRLTNIDQGEAGRVFGTTLQGNSLPDGPKKVVTRPRIVVCKITGKKIPVTQRNSSESPSKLAAAALSAQKELLIGPHRKGKTRAVTSVLAKPFAGARTPPKIKPLAGIDRVDPYAVINKAKGFGMKIWSTEKLELVLDRLLDKKSPTKTLLNVRAQLANNAQGPGLNALLRHEQLTGTTYERDAATLRPDFVYLHQSHGYLIVEDSIGEYQPAHLKIYEQRIHPKASEPKDRETLWPTLWGGQEGRGAFQKPSASYSGYPLMDPVMRVKHLCPDLPHDVEKWPIAFRHPRWLAQYGVTNHPEIHNSSLRRAASTSALQPLKERNVAANVARGRTLRSSTRRDSFMAASGNSQIITSNIASATSATTTRSGQVIGKDNSANGGNSLANGIIIDKRLARLGSKAKKHIITFGGNKSTTTTANGLLAPPAQTAAPTLHRSVSLDTGLNKMRNYQPREQPKKPGYCENCRLRYDDFKAHTRSKKHRRFALDLWNWVDLDILLESIKRPVLPELLQMYEAAGCEVPSDVDASDNEDEGDADKDNMNGALDDSGFCVDEAEHRYQHEIMMKRYDDILAGKKDLSTHNYTSGDDDDSENSDSEEEDALNGEGSSDEDDNDDDDE